MSHLNQEAAHCQPGNANWKKLLFLSPLEGKKGAWCQYMHPLEPSQWTIFHFNSKEGDICRT